MPRTLTRVRTLLVAAAALALGAAVLAVAVRQEKKPAVDRHGDLLPPHAVAWPGHPRNHAWSGYPLLAFVTPTLLVSAGDDGPVRVWNVTRQRELCRLPVPAKSHVSAIVPSPDRKHVFVGGWDEKEGFWTVWE